MEATFVLYNNVVNDDYQRHTFVPLPQGNLLCPEQSIPMSRLPIINLGER